MFALLEMVELTLPRVLVLDHATGRVDEVKRGAIGTIVEVHRGGEAYELEFTDDAGKTLAVITATPDMLRWLR